MPFLSGFILMCYALFWDAILVRFYINVFMLYFEMSFLPGLIIMRLFPLVRWHYCQVWFWCLYALFWDVILVMFDINVCLPSFEMSFLSGLILMCLCPLLRCHFCQVLYWCLYILFLDAILVNMSSSSRLLVPLFVWGRLHTGASQEKRK